MDIFQTETQISKQELAITGAKNLAIFNKASLDLLKERLETSFKMLWSNGMSEPQEILDVYGENASKLFQAAGATIAFIKALDPDYTGPTPPIEYSITIHENGSVTAVKNNNT